MAEVAADGQRPLRILMIAPTSFFSDYGGHIRILEETRALQALGHRVAIVTYYKGSDLPGIDIRRTPRLPWHAEYEVGSSRHKLAFDVYLTGQTLLEARRFRPDVIHGHMHEGALIGGLLARLTGKPLVFDFQGSLTGEMVDHNFLREDGRVYDWVHRLERFINGLPAVILTSSGQARALLTEQFGVPAAKIRPLPDCANTSRFDPDKFSPVEKKALKAGLGIDNGRPVVAYLGLLTEYQGISHLLESARLLLDRGLHPHFLVMGYPNAQHYQEQAAARGLGDHMTFTGKVEYRHAPLYLSLGDIAVAPKMSSTEGSGKVLNYMAMRQPVVAYDTAVHREYLAEWGVYAPVGDARAFADGIARLIADEALRQKLGQGLLARAESIYSWQAMMKQVVEIYRGLTGRD